MNCKKLILVSLLTLSACATTPVPVVRDANSNFVISRDAGHAGSFCDVTVLIDAKVVAVLRPEMSYQTKLPPGKHKVEVSLSAICGGSDHRSAVFILSEDLAEFRVGFVAYSGIRLDRVE